MVSTLSSVVIAPPDGDLAVYLDSLRRLQTYPARLLLPAHGSPARAAAALEDCLRHRRQREEQLLAVLGPTSRTVADLARELYRGLPSAPLSLAEQQTLAGLRKLQNEGRAVKEGSAWRAGRPTPAPLSEPEA